MKLHSILTTSVFKKIFAAHQVFDIPGPPFTTFYLGNFTHYLGYFFHWTLNGSLGCCVAHKVIIHDVTTTCSISISEDVWHSFDPLLH